MMMNQTKIISTLMEIGMRVPVRAQNQTLVRNFTEIPLFLKTDTEMVEETTGQAYKSLKHQLHIPVKQVSENISYTLRWCQSLINGMTEPRLLS